MNAGQEKLRRF